MYGDKNRDKANSCLFVVDVQNGFISKKTDHILPRIKSLLEKDLFDYVIFTRFINTANSPYTRFLGWDKVSIGEETEISDLLQPFAKNIYQKNTYTTLTQALKQFLKSHNIAIGFICGIDTDCCVLKTAVDLFELGIQPRVLTYYSASNGGEKSHKAAITVLVRLIGSHNIIEYELSRHSFFGTS